MTTILMKIQILRMAIKMQKEEEVGWWQEEKKEKDAAYRLQSQDDYETNC
jgi:hypothetical protein